MLWTKTNSLKGLNLGLMNIHESLALIGQRSPTGTRIGAAGAGSEESAKVKKTSKTFTLFPPDASRSNSLGVISQEPRRGGNLIALIVDAADDPGFPQSVAPLLASFHKRVQTSFVYVVFGLVKVAPFFCLIITVVINITISSSSRSGCSVSNKASSAGRRVRITPVFSSHKCVCN